MSESKKPLISRREAIARVGGITAAAVLTGCEPGTDSSGRVLAAGPVPVAGSPPESVEWSGPVVLETLPLGFPWTTRDPFLFCVHHLDEYPAGDEQMGPDGGVAGRRIGMDFSNKDGWSMYHGDVVPGFPSHPHRGFETITLARQGYIDHSDSLGATARFGHGDVQWMTAGRGIVHAEMFPLVNRDEPNTTELFQIWLNLPRAGKMVEPHFTMMWSHTIPQEIFTDANGGRTEVTVVAGAVEGLATPPSPPPNSWASQAEADVAVWTLRMSPGATWTIPPASGPEVNRTLYFFRGESMQIGERRFTESAGVRVDPLAPIHLINGAGEGELLMLQGRPIGEPVAKQGPFVMNTREEIVQAYADYRQTRFGGWPFSDPAPTHARDAKRFAIHADGREESADG